MEAVQNGNENPLKNPLILEQIFNYLDKIDLAACRQTSRLWHEHSLKAWRSSVKVIISMKERRSMSDFLQFVTNEDSNHSNKPFVTKYVLLEIENSPRFWSVSGQSLKQLCLAEVKFGSLSDLRDFIYNSCPSLERLELLDVRVDGAGPSVIEPTELMEPEFKVNRKLKHLKIKQKPGNPYPLPSWMELLTHFPSIDSLTFMDDTPNCHGLLTSLSLIRETFPNNLQIKHITAYLIDNGIRARLLDVMRDPRLHLVTLIINFINESEFQEIFTVHAGTLQKLAFHGLKNQVDPNTFFPSRSLAKLDSLEEFELREEFFSSIAFLKYMPNIKKLFLGSFSGSLYCDSDLAELEDITLANCEELELECYSCKSDSSRQSDEVFRKLMRCLPNLKRFETVYLFKDDFPLVCELCPKLVSLKIYGSNLNGWAITGLDAKHVVRINKEGQACVWRPITVPRANITNLKDLQTFVLRTTSKTEDDQLNYCSVLCGIQQLPRLRNLLVDIGKCFKPECKIIWDRLNSQFPLPSGRNAQ